MSYHKHKDNIQDFLIFKIEELKLAGISNASQEINWLLQTKFSIKKERLIFKNNFFLKETEYNQLNKYINRRLNHEPFQYIINSAPFYGLDLYVDNKVLIPRPESEIFIEIIKKKQFFSQSTLDVGTGSGNLALAIAVNKLSKKITAIDISKKAVRIAKKNFSKYNIDYINCFQDNFLTIKFKEKFDLIVSNPPYVSFDEYRQLDKTVKHYEPKKALTDGSTGLTFYKKLSGVACDLLEPRGTLLIEIGLEKNKKIIQKLFKNYSIKWHKDLQNNNRIIEIRR